MNLSVSVSASVNYEICSHLTSHKCYARQLEGLWMPPELLNTYVCTIICDKSDTHHTCHKHSLYATCV